MAGKFRKIQSLLWPVKVVLPTGRTESKKVKGRLIEQEVYDEELIQIKFKRLDKDQAADFSARHSVADDREASTPDRLDAHESMVAEIQSELLLGWNIDDENGDPLEFNDENVAMVMAHPDYNKAIINAFFQMQSGGARKN